MLRYHIGKLDNLSSNYQLPPMTCSQLIVNWLLGSVSKNVPPPWTLISKQVKHINNSMILWNMMKWFMSDVKRVAIDKVCCKYKIKYWEYRSAINIWDNVKDYFNIKYISNTKRKNPS